MTIHLDGKKQNSNKSLAKANNNELQIYIDPFPSHSTNLVIQSSTSSQVVPSEYVNMVSFTCTPPPKNAGATLDRTFNSHDDPINKELSPLYIPT